MLSSFMKQILTDAAIMEMTATGGLLFQITGLICWNQEDSGGESLPAIVVAPFLIHLLPRL